MSDRLRVLVLTYETPSYPGGGGASRQHLLLEPLAAGHTVRIVSTGGPPPFGAPPAGAELVLVDPGPEVEADGTWLRKNAAHFLRGRPWLHLLAEHHRRALARRLPHELDAFRPDAVVVQHGELGGLLDMVPPRVAAVLELHNMLVAVQAQQVLGGRGGAWAGAKSALEVPLMARWERRDLLRATVAVAASRRDEALARRLARRARVVLVENCVDTAYFAPGGARSEPGRVLFAASFHYPPNADAAVDLLRRVLPALRRRHPGAVLALVGQRMPAALARLAADTPGCDCVGAVADVRPELHRAAVALAPLRRGSGSPLKVIEAMASGTPVVVSPRVRRALDLAPGDGILEAAGAGGTAAAVAGLLDDPGRAAALGARGAAVALERFEARRAAALFEEAVRQAVASARALTPS